MMQCGGDDQWSNILGGTELNPPQAGQERLRHDDNPAADQRGQEEGKTQAGAVWLDPDKTSPYDF